MSHMRSLIIKKCTNLLVNVVKSMLELEDFTLNNCETKVFTLDMISFLNLKTNTELL